jgi:hypothetical protein
VCDYRWGIDWMSGFIVTLYTPLGPTRDYSAIADLHTLQFTVTHTHTHTLGFSVFTSRFLSTDFNTVIIYQSHCNCSTHEVFLAQPNSFLAISRQSSLTAVPRDSFNSDSAESESESYVTTDNQSASLSWYKAPIPGLRPDFFPRSEYGIRYSSVLDSVGRPL